MKNVHIVFNFIQLSIPEKVAKGRNIIIEMSDNATFPNPDVPLSELKVATDVLETRYLDAQNGGKENTVLMHQAEEVWDDMMRKLARYVERMAGEDSSIVLNAGFDLAKQPIPSQRPEFSAEPGTNSGAVLLRRRVVPGAKSYIWQYCINFLPETADGWKIAEVTGKASVELKNLNPTTKYWFRVAIVTSNETLPYNDPIMLIVT
jgi:hypothetical protein